MFIEIELATMQDLGYNIDRSSFFGRSFYVDGDGKTAVYNSTKFDSPSVYGIGSHMFASNLNVVQTGNIRTTGPGAAGIRVDGVGNTLTIANGTSVYTGVAKATKLSATRIDAENHSDLFTKFDWYHNYNIRVNGLYQFCDANGNPTTLPALYDADGTPVRTDKNGNVIDKNGNVVDYGNIRLYNGMIYVAANKMYYESDEFCRLYDGQWGMSYENEWRTALPFDFYDSAGNRLNTFNLVEGILRDGVDGVGLLVSYGKDHHIIHQGTIVAEGYTGTGVLFDFGEPVVGARLGSYAFDPYYGYMEEGKGTGGYPEDLQGPLVKSFDITGTIIGSKVRAADLVFEHKHYTTVEFDEKGVVIVDENGNITNRNPDHVLWGGLHGSENTGVGGPEDPDPNNDAAKGNYGTHATLKETPDGITPTIGDKEELEPGETRWVLDKKGDILVIIQNDANELIEIRKVNQTDGQYIFTKDEYDGGLLFPKEDQFCWVIFDKEMKDADGDGAYFVPPQPEFTVDVRGGAIYIAGSRLDSEIKDLLGKDVIQGGAYVETINIMNGAVIKGDIISYYSDNQERTTTINFGLKADAQGCATLQPDSDFRFVYNDNIGYYPYWEKAFDVLPHHLEFNGDWEYTDERGFYEVAPETGRFKLGGDPNSAGFELHFAGGFTTFGVLETDPNDEHIQLNISKIHSVLIDYDATLELSKLRLENPKNAGETQDITRSLDVSDSFINNGRLSGESGVWVGGYWTNDSVWNGQRGINNQGGGIWIDNGKGTLINQGIIAPGPNNGYGEIDTYDNNILISGQKTGMLAIAGNLDLSNRNSVYEVTITDGRQITATLPDWDTTLYWNIDSKTDKLTLEQNNASAAWNIDPVTGLPVNDEREIIDGGWGVGDSDRLVVSGSTKLGGTLVVHVTPGDYSLNPTTYTIIRSEGGFTPGTNFENIEHYIGFLTFEPYDLNASNTYINPYNGKDLQFTVIRDTDYFKKYGKTFNEIATATAIDNSLFDSYRVAFSLADDRNTTADLRNMYHQISGAIRANSLMINLWNPSEILFPRIGWGNGQMETGNRGRIDWSRPVGGKKTKMLNQASARNRVGSLWGEFMNTTLNAESDGNSDGYSFNRSGFMIGSEWSLTPYSAIEATVSYHNSTLKQVGDKVKSDDYLLGTYFVAAPFNTFEFKAYMGLGMQEYDSERRIYNTDIITERIPLRNGITEILRGVNDRYTGQTRGNSFNLSLEIAKPLELHPTFILRPTLGIDTQHVWQSGYVENDFGEVLASYGSNIYALRYSRAYHNRGMLRAGFSSETSGYRGGIRMRVFYVNQFAGNQYPISTAVFATGGERFTVRGVDMGNSYLHLGVGANYWLDGERTSAMFFDYDANIYNVSYKVNTHIVNFGLLQKF
jgi:hypothetical protein